MSQFSQVPELRVRMGNSQDVDKSREFVLYWMTAFRRTTWNYSLQRAVDWSRELHRPLLVLEGLRTGYAWASDRLHHFVIQGMHDNRQSFERRNVLYYPYLEPEPGGGRGLLETLADKACVVVGDDYPSFFLPRMIKAAGSRISSRFELVDSNGILPLRAADRVFTTAYSFRRYLQKNLRNHLQQFPTKDPLARVKLPAMDMPRGVSARWPAAEVAKRATDPGSLTDFAIDHDVTLSPLSGGSVAAGKRLRAFIKHTLANYDELRNHPDEDAGSGLSPYLHFGQVSSHQMFHEVMQYAGWHIDDLDDKANGRREGWWQTRPSVEAFVDQLITWRELGYNMAWQRTDTHCYTSLPNWALKTLADHTRDPRPYVYSLEQFEHADTHDEIWNAAQRQLVHEGRMHNYLRMLWGKKILHWTATPRDALEIMIELNDKYALDGRDPNSSSGIFWVLGRYDRAWGPERKIFGKVRYMTSDNTARKVHLKRYLERYGPGSETRGGPSV